MNDRERIEWGMADVATVLEVFIDKREVTFPQKITDFDLGKRITFSAMMDGKRIGGQVKVFSKDISFRTPIKRKFAWAILVELKPAKKYIKLAEQIYDMQYPNRNMLWALILYYWKSFTMRYRKDPNDV